MSGELLYTNFVQSVNLEDIFVKDLSVKRNLVSLADEEELDAKVEMVPKVQLISDNYLIALVKFHVTALTKENLDIFSIDLEYMLVYEINTDNSLSEQELEVVADLFVKRNVPINVWPFARELVADLSNRMNVPRLLIGMYRYIPNKETDEGQDD